MAISLVLFAAPLFATPEAIDYAAMSREAALKKQYVLMLEHCGNDAEKGVLRLSYDTVLWLHKYRGQDEVGLADLMAHALQESYATIARKGREGDTAGLWAFHSPPGNDLMGFISWGVWQTVTPQVLRLGKEYSAEIKTLYQEYITGYGASIWNFKNKMKEKDGAKEAGEKYLALVSSLEKILAKRPGLNALVAAEIIGTNYRSYGKWEANAIRSYFWLAIQKDLKPDKWLNEVRFNDDIPPTAANNWADNNARKRGDYGKQVALGNFYNGRGIIYWLAAAADEVGMRELVAAWHDDPARLKKSDYLLLERRGHLRWAGDDQALFEYILAFLEDK